MKEVALFVGLMFFVGLLMFIFQPFFYTIAVSCYHSLIRIASTFNKKAKLWVKGRTNLFDNLKVHFQDYTKKTVWFHCASLGEFEQGRPIMEQLKIAHPDVKIILTFYSPSGYEVQ